MQLLEIGSQRVALIALVMLAAAGSFLVPLEWFLLINPAQTEIVALQSRQADRKGDLANMQEKRHQAERLVLLAKSNLEVSQNALMRLVRQQVSPGIVRDPFREGPSLTRLLRDIRQDEGLNEGGGGASEFLTNMIDEARGRLNDYTNRSETISAALEKFDDAQRELSSSQSDFKQVEIQIGSIEEEIRVDTARAHEIMRQSTNQYLAMRAVTLGALGAFAAALAAFLHGAAPGARLQHGRIMLSMAFGSIVALVVFALFTTRELSVFANDGATPAEIPDYWRVVILCLIAGAFADRLFAAARERVDHMTRGQDERGGKPAQA